MHSVFTADILPLDVIIKIPGPAQFTALTNRYNLAADGKTPIGGNVFRDISHTLFHEGDLTRPSQELVDLSEGHPFSLRPGGSSANTTSTYLKAIRGSGIFFGIAGNDSAGDRIRASLRSAKMDLVPDHLCKNGEVQTSVSFSFRHTDDEIGKEYTSYAIFRGNAKQLLRPEDVTHQMIDSVKVVYVPASLCGEKMDAEIFHRILMLRWELGKDLWFSPHTGEAAAKANASYVQGLLRSVNRSVGSVREFSWSLLPHIATENIDPSQTLEELQRIFAERFLERAGRAKKHEQIAFVTDGERGAYVVTADYIHHIPVGQTAMRFSFGGGGDAAAAGALAALDVGLSPFDAGLVGQEFSAAKVETTYGPRLEGDPVEDHLRPRNRSLAERFSEGLPEYQLRYESRGHYGRALRGSLIAAR